MDTLTGTQKTPSAMKKAMKKNINKGENWRRFGKKKKAKQIIHLMTVVLETFQRSSLTLRSLCGMKVHVCYVNLTGCFVFVFH